MTEHPIFSAVRNKRLDEVKRIVLDDKNALEAQTERTGYSPLMVACSLRDAGDRDRIIEFLIDQGANVNYRRKIMVDSNHRSALEAAAGSGDNALVRLLLNHGAHNPFGWSLLSKLLSITDDWAQVYTGTTCLSNAKTGDAEDEEKEEKQNDDDILLSKQIELAQLRHQCEVEKVTRDFEARKLLKNIALAKAELEKMEKENTGKELEAQAKIQSLSEEVLLLEKACALEDVGETKPVLTEYSAMDTDPAVTPTMVGSTGGSNQMVSTIGSHCSSSGAAKEVVNLPQETVSEDDGSSGGGSDADFIQLEKIK